MVAASAGRFSEAGQAQLAEIVSHYPDPGGAILPALWLAQREYGGWLPADAIAEVAARLGRPASEIQGVATFYTMYNTQQRGRRHIEVCTCLTCGCLGAYEVIDRLEQILGIHLGQTTADGEFTLTEAECLNYCEAATVVQVGERYFGGVNAENAADLVARLRGSEGCTPESLSNAIVEAIVPGRNAGATHG
ncbi:MAG: NAD(P)H-dependent oxidoreductase subunit E [Armatimonadetes bacterium]|nr:NAD(P)H-dependent oxidoreductase subunit E [Armatimonadota bacterium]